nr:MAG TPA: hypothetical protein [Caudoviricetes sp.]
MFLLYLVYIQYTPKNGARQEKSQDTLCLS